MPDRVKYGTLACQTSRLIKSVMIVGEASFIEEPEEKGQVMKTLMEKLQPVSSHVPLGEK